MNRSRILMCLLCLCPMVTGVALADGKNGKNGPHGASIALPNIPTVPKTMWFAAPALPAGPVASATPAALPAVAAPPAIGLGAAAPGVAPTPIARGRERQELDDRGEHYLNRHPNWQNAALRHLSRGGKQTANAARQGAQDLASAPPESARTVSAAEAAEEAQVMAETKLRTLSACR